MDAEEPTSETHRTAWNIRMGHHVREFVFGAHTYIWARTRLLCWRLTNGFGTGENKSLLSKFKLLFNPYPPSGGQFVRAESAADDECRWIVVCFCGLNTGNYHNEIAILQTELYRDSLGAETCGCVWESHPSFPPNHLITQFQHTLRDKYAGRSVCQMKRDILHFTSSDCLLMSRK